MDVQRESIPRYLRYWINSLPSPSCALVSSCSDLRDGVIFTEILFHALGLHVPNVSSKSSSCGRTRAVINSLTNYVGAKYMPKILFEQHAADKICSEQETEYTWTLLEFLYDLHSKLKKNDVENNKENSLQNSERANLNSELQVLDGRVLSSLNHQPGLDKDKRDKERMVGHILYPETIKSAEFRAARTMTTSRDSVTLPLRVDGRAKLGLEKKLLENKKSSVQTSENINSNTNMSGQSKKRLMVQSAKSSYHSSNSRVGLNDHESYRIAQQRTSKSSSPPRSRSRSPRKVVAQSSSTELYEKMVSQQITNRGTVRNSAIIDPAYSPRTWNEVKKETGEKDSDRIDNSSESESESNTAGRYRRGNVTDRINGMLGSVDASTRENNQLVLTNYFHFTLFN